MSWLAHSLFQLAPQFQNRSGTINVCVTLICLGHHHSFNVSVPLKVGRTGGYIKKHMGNYRLSKLLST